MDSAGFGTRVFGRAACGSVPFARCGRIANWSRVTGSGVAADHQRSRWLGGTRITLPRRDPAMDPAGFGTTVFARAACGSVPFPDAAASRIGPGSPGRVSRLITSAVGGLAARGSRCRVGPGDGSSRFRDPSVRSGGVRVGAISRCGRIANWSRVTGSGVAADHQRSRWLGGTRITLPRRTRRWIPAGFGTTVFARAACGSVPFPDAAASRIGPGSPGRVSRLITSAVGGLVARGSRCRVGPGDGSSRFRDHRVRSSGVRVGAISRCGRIANWSRVTGSGVAADHQRSRWLGGTRIPLPRRTRRWIQQVSEPPCPFGRRAGRCHFRMRPHRELVPGHRVGCRG
jgi:ribosome modulation factor